MIFLSFVLQWLDGRNKAGSKSSKPVVLQKMSHRCHICRFNLRLGSRASKSFKFTSRKEIMNRYVTVTRCYLCSCESCMYLLCAIKLQLYGTLVGTGMKYFLVSSWATWEYWGLSWVCKIWHPSRIISSTLESYLHKTWDRGGAMHRALRQTRQSSSLSSPMSHLDLC